MLILVSLTYQRILFSYIKLVQICARLGTNIYFLIKEKMPQINMRIDKAVFSGLLLEIVFLPPITHILHLSNISHIMNT